MEDLEEAPGSPTMLNGDEPQGNIDPGDPLQPGLEEEHEPNAPIADPTADVDALEDDAPDERPGPERDPAEDISGDESDLDDLDEAQFDNFDPEAANIVVPDQPVAVDESNVALLGVHKRKRTEGEERERKKKKKEGRRERTSKKANKTRAADGEEEEFEGGEEIDGKRSRRSKVGPDGRNVKAARRPRTPDNEDELSPEERRRRALERKMDEALRTNRPVRRRGGGIDIQDAGEQELEILRHKMANAAQADNEARKRDQPASHKLKLLPSAMELLNRNTLRPAILDPEINILEAVRFFLEPADEDAALPNYQIQREMFAMLSRLHMSKEAMIASGIGKVVVYYTKSNQPQPAIKRQAEKLVQAWMGVVLNKKHAGNAKQVETRLYDPLTASQRALANATQLDRVAILAERRRKALEPPAPGNRARVEGGVGTYSVAPVNNLSNQYQNARRMGASGEDAFRRMAARAQTKGSGAAKR